MREELYFFHLFFHITPLHLNIATNNSSNTDHNDNKSNDYFHYMPNTKCIKVM